MFSAAMRRLGLTTVIFAGLGTCLTAAEQIVIDGYYDCQRATNGRAYCKQRGYSPRQVFGVSDEFFARFEFARTGRSPPTSEPQPIVNQLQINETTTNIAVIAIYKDLADLKGQQSLLEKLIQEQKAIEAAGSDAAAASTVKALEAHDKALGGKIASRNQELSKYTTAIRPDDKNLYQTARKQSEVFTKIPYFIPGTPETGEFWVEPIVKDDGTLVFAFRFVDVDSTASDKVRSSIEMTPEEIEIVRNSLSKIFANSKIAHENKVRRNVVKRVACFPQADCPPEGGKIDRKSSTEIIFYVNEDGSTGGRIQRNKGRFDEGYNLSVDSALLLGAYLKHIGAEGKSEHEVGSRSAEDLKKLFE